MHIASPASTLSQHRPLTVVSPLCRGVASGWSERDAVAAGRDCGRRQQGQHERRQDGRKSAPNCCWRVSAAIIIPSLFRVHLCILAMMVHRI